MMKKIMSVFTLAGVTTFGLFVFMAFLISNDQVGITKTLPSVVVDVVQLPEDSKPKVFKRNIIEPPKPPVMPKSQILAVDTEINSEFTYAPPELIISNKIPTAATFTNRGNEDARPIIRVNPKYPMDALRNGLQGWVVLVFDINEIGEVTNVKVIDSEPKRVFDNAAKKALKKWKYKAKSVNGKEVKQRNLTVQLDFNMEQQT